MTDTAAQPIPPDEEEGDDTAVHVPADVLEAHEAIEFQRAVDDADGVGG